MVLHIVSAVHLAFYKTFNHFCNVSIDAWPVDMLVRSSSALFNTHMPFMDLLHDTFLMLLGITTQVPIKISPPSVES